MRDSEVDIWEIYLNKPDFLWIYSKVSMMINSVAVTGHS